MYIFAICIKHLPGGHIMNTVNMLWRVTFEPNRESHCSYYEFLLEAVCHILTLVMKDKLELSNFELLWLESYLSRK